MMMSFVIRLIAYSVSFSFAKGDFDSVSGIVKHSLFFDVDLDGVIEMHETKERMLALGFSEDDATQAAIRTNDSLGPATGGGSDENPGVHYLCCPAGMLHKGSTNIWTKPHGITDVERRDEVFYKFDKNDDGYLTETEIRRMILRHTFEDKGHLEDVLRSRAEFFNLLFPIASEIVDGKEAISYDTWVKLYDGRLLYEIAGLEPPFAVTP